MGSARELRINLLRLTFVKSNSNSIKGSRVGDGIKGCTGIEMDEY